MRSNISRTFQNPIKLCIWSYVLLLLVEGALRKWVMPGLSDVLLIARDPFVFLIYAMVFSKNRFPQNNFLAVAFLLAFLSLLGGLLAENSNLFVTVYGLRINYMHLPLIFIIGQEIDQEECILIGRFFILLSIPMTLLLVAQFLQPQSAWVNKGIGGMEGGGITGALGRFRPPGTFSYITGVAAFYPLVTAFLLFEIMRPRKTLPMWFLITVGVAVVVAIPVSISRLTALSCLIVFLVGIFCFYKVQKTQTKYLKFLFIAVFIYLLLPVIPGFDLGVEAFSARWDDATGEGLEGVKENIVLRQIENFMEPVTVLPYVPVMGYGIGYGSNVGARFMTGSVGFTLAEGEWAKCVMELGPILGFSFIAFRIWLFVALFKNCLKALKQHNNPLPLLIMSAVGLLLLYGQWGPPTIQGFAMLGTGLVIASWRVPRARSVPSKPQESPAQ